MKGVHQMREDHTEDMELNKEMEDIRQVPLEQDSRGPGKAGWRFVYRRRSASGKRRARYG